VVAYRNSSLNIHSVRSALVTKEQGTTVKTQALHCALSREAEGFVNRLREQLRERLLDYCKRHPVRNQTCLVKAIRSAPRLFSADSVMPNRRLLVVSDMLEDCYAQGDPKSLSQLRERIGRSLKDYQLPDLDGLRILAARIYSSKDPLDVDVLRVAWEQGLDSSHARFSIGPIKSLLRNTTQ
jgi:hypothetical protein